MSARETLAWLMWCYSEGYVKREDRAIMTSWFDEPQLLPEDEETRDGLLEMADEILNELAREAK